MTATQLLLWPVRPGRVCSQAGPLLLSVPLAGSHTMRRRALKLLKKGEALRLSTPPKLCPLP